MLVLLYKETYTETNDVVINCMPETDFFFFFFFFFLISCDQSMLFIVSKQPTRQLKNPLMIHSIY